MEKFLKVNVKLPAPVETGALISAIQFLRYEDRLSGKKKLQSHNLAEKAAASLLASQPQSQSRAVLLPKCFTNPGVLGVCCRNVNGVPPPPQPKPPTSPTPPSNSALGRFQGGECLSVVSIFSLVVHNFLHALDECTMYR